MPLTLLTAAQGKPMLVELKNGVTFNGHLVECDNFMNVTLREVYQTSADGDRFWKMKEMFIKGNMIKYFRIADAILDQAAEEQEKQRAAMRSRGGSRGGTLAFALPNQSPCHLFFWTMDNAAMLAYHLFGAFQLRRS
ncbi:Probable U6 snRNA-associated Sm-like protein LSm4 [Saitozyma sp. JCM 24511]|nr:Probable U6 snRNA-associated Sm-like protein LSm4 [Saitozyma sp. JCM 24511]